MQIPQLVQILQPAYHGSHDAGCLPQWEHQIYLQRLLHQQISALAVLHNEVDPLLVLVMLYEAHHVRRVYLLQALQLLLKKGAQVGLVVLLQADQFHGELLVALVLDQVNAAEGAFPEILNNVVLIQIHNYFISCRSTQALLELPFCKQLSQQI